VAAGQLGDAMKLEVAESYWADVYKDMARVPQAFRLAANGKPIHEGTICSVTVGSRTVLLSLRQQVENPGNAAIYIDEKTRNALGVAIRDTKEFTFRPVGWLGVLKWVWQASDPAYRVGARLGIAGFILGMIGLILGVISLRH
jgi:hypothetical protein